MLMRSLAVASIVTMSLAAAAVAPQPRLTPFSTAPGSVLPAPWRIVTLPKIPKHTTYAIAETDGRRAVRADADGSYANVVHPVGADVGTVPFLRFSWRVDRFSAGSNLTTKEGDDVAAKVCVLFDVPLDRLSFADRTKIEFGRRLFEPDLPAATVCYLWDRTAAPGTLLNNAYTDRVRMLVLRSAANGDERRWFEERRDLRADFRRAFPREAEAGLPPVAAIAFATDADNTSGHALAWFGDLSLAAE